MTNGALPWFVTVTTWGVLVVPCTSLPNAKVDGETFAIGAPAYPVNTYNLPSPTLVGSVALGASATLTLPSLLRLVEFPTSSDPMPSDAAIFWVSFEAVQPSADLA